MAGGGPRRRDGLRAASGGGPWRGAGRGRAASAPGLARQRQPAAVGRFGADDSASGRGQGRLEAGRGPDPAAKTVHLGFQAEPLAVDQGQVEVSAAVTWDSKDLEDVPILPLLLRLQACDEKSCQLPQTLTLRVPVATVVGP